jgi:diaminobutyrate-2-oxoglutarate transaminase
MAAVHGLSLRGRGMMLGVDAGSGDTAAAVCAACFEQGLIIETSGSHDEVIKVLAPLTIKPAQFRAGLDTLEAAFDAVLGRRRIAAE